MAVRRVRGAFRRAVAWLSTALGALVAGLFKTGSLDAVCLAPPSTALALSALAASYVGRAKIFLDVTDASPGARVDPDGGRFARWFGDRTAAITNLCYRRAHTVFCASDDVREAVLSRCGPETEVLVARDGFQRLAPSAARPIARTDREFVATYAGNMGVESGLDLVLDAARELRDQPQVRFVLIGDGSEAARLRDRIRTERIDNVSFLGVLEQAASLAALEESDLAVVILRKDAVNCVPSKMFDALSVGCPLLLSGRGEAELFVEAAGAGWCVPPEDAAALAAAIRRASSDVAGCRNRGRAGREYALANYDCDRIVLGVVRHVFAATSPAINRRDTVLVQANVAGTSDS